jgi:hypothetical protein
MLTLEPLEPRELLSRYQVFPGANALQAAVSRPLLPDDFVEVHTGHYQGFCADQSGALNNHITIEAFGDGPVIIDQPGPVNGDGSGAMFVGQHWYLKNITIQNLAGNGITDKGNFIYLVNDQILNCARYGVYASHTYRFSSIGSTIAHNALGGIYADAVLSFQVKSANIISSNAGPGIECTDGCTGNIVGNFFSGNTLAIELINSPGVYVGSNQGA